MTGDLVIYELLAADDSDTTGGWLDVVRAVGILVFGAVMYFLPTIIVLARKVRNAGSVFVVNLFTGWTFIGWVVALAMAARTVDYRDD